jgi:hypothetical protein
MGKSYQYGHEVLDFIKVGRLIYSRVKSLHLKVRSSTEENLRTLTVWTVPYCLANFAGETYVLVNTGDSVSASFTLHDRHLLTCSVDKKPTTGC